MDRCQSCQNILPRTVDRCPVCGETTIAPVAESAPAADTTPQGKDFLDAIGSKRQRMAKTPSISAPRSNRRPSRTGHDGATPIYEAKVSAEERESDFDLPNLSTETRTVAAISSRLNSNINIGRRRAHAGIVVAAVVTAVAALGAGTAVGFQRTNVPAQIAMSALDVPVRSTDAPIVVTGQIEGFDPAALVAIREAGTCDGTVNSRGITVDGGTIVAPLVPTQHADSPMLSTGELQTSGDVLGLSNPNDLTILRPADRIENRLRLATTTSVRVGTRLALVSVDGEAVTLSPAVVTEFETRDGSVHSFSIGTEFSEDQPTESAEFPRGTILVDENGDLLGMAGNNGSFVTATRIATTVARYQADPTFPDPVCQ